MLFHGTTNEWSDAEIADWFGAKSYQVWVDALWGAIQAKRPFFSMVTTPYLHLFMNAYVAYIEELVFHYYDNQEETEKGSLPKLQEFSLVPPNLMVVPNGAMIVKHEWSLVIFQG